MKLLKNTLIKLHPNEYNQELHFHPRAVKLDKMCRKLYTLNYLSNNRICVPNKTGDLNINIFNMITGKNESKILTKDM